MPDTICGYDLADVRRTLRDTIDRRERRAAARWTAELVATPGAIGSLWASYWLAWAAAQGAGSASPTVPILLRQTWEEMGLLIRELGGDWVAFRNEPAVRAATGEMTIRLLDQPRQTPVIWPAKDIVTFDVSQMRDGWAAGSVPSACDGVSVMRVWTRDDDAMDLRMLGGSWIDSLERGDLRVALSAVAWTMTAPNLKCQQRGPSELTAKQRSSPLWFWLELGRAYLAGRQGLHPGWLTFHRAVADAMRQHYKRWTAADRMRILLAWILQIRASCLPQPESLWAAPAVSQTTAQIDLAYQEVAAELANPNAPILGPAPPPEDPKVSAKKRMEEKMAEADAILMATLGLEDDG